MTPVRNGRSWPLVLLLLALFAGSLLEGQEAPTGPPGKGATLDKIVEGKRAESKGESTNTVDVSGKPVPSLIPEVACRDIDDAPTRDRCWKAHQAYFDYYATGLEHRKKVIAWQHVSTVVIFYTVLILVFAGIYFAAIQFHRPAGQKAGQEVDVGHEVELSLGGIKVRSPVLGVVVLTLSLAFFYLYLVHVYPIVEIL